MCPFWVHLSGVCPHAWPDPLSYSRLDSPSEQHGVVMWRKHETVLRHPLVKQQQRLEGVHHRLTGHDFPRLDTFRPGRFARRLANKIVERINATKTFENKRWHFGLDTVRHHIATSIIIVASNSEEWTTIVFNPDIYFFIFYNWSIIEISKSY